MREKNDRLVIVKPGLKLRSISFDDLETRQALAVPAER